MKKSQLIRGTSNLTFRTSRVKQRRDEDWQVHRVASQDMWDVGAITGNVKLHIDDTGKPHIMFFGAFGRTDGPWIAALTE